MPELADKVSKGLRRARNQVAGILTPNRRHESLADIQRDQIMEEIKAGHRFQSFACERSDNFVKWHIDGHDYMWALSELLDNAKEVIFIMDWWLTPELYLRRPPAYHAEWRLDRILGRKAQQGVKIYVIVNKELRQSMPMNSKHTKSELEAIHPNITCLRHPDHIGAKDSVQFWAHNENVVIVDNTFACIGGIDLSFGRWDTHNHPLADVHPTDFSKTLFPGQDYNNARIMNFKNVSAHASNTLSILDSARMPSHDVHTTLSGPVVLDIVQHFVERWNEIKKRKYRDNPRVDWLALPHDIDASPTQPVTRHPHREMWNLIGHRYRHESHPTSEHRDEESSSHHWKPQGATCNVQVVRSVSDWSHGVLTERSIQNAYIQLIYGSEHFIYIENQFFISTTQEKGVVKNLIAKALVERILYAAREGRKFKVVVVVPEVPGFTGSIKNESSLRMTMAAQYRTINRGGNSIYEEIRKAGYEPMDYIRFYHLRVYDRINAPVSSLIAQMEENSGISFHEAQAALARQWVGEDSALGQKEVTLSVPEPTNGEVIISDKTSFKTITVKIPESEEDARQTIDRFEHGSDDIKGDEDVSDNVCQHKLSGITSLEDELWVATPDEELNAYVTEQLYVHSKLMIVDDRIVIIGSANINDRSQKGDGDSEIALVIEDQNMRESTMDGQPFRVAKFAASLRCKLWREHLGLIEPQEPQEHLPSVTSFMRPAPHENEAEFGTDEDELVADPISESTLTLWDRTAFHNSQIYAEVFRTVPSNLVRNWATYDYYVPKVKTGHVAPGVPLATVRQRLSKVRGALVTAPLEFLIEEKDFVAGPQWVGLGSSLPIYL